MISNELREFVCIYIDNEHVYSLGLIMIMIMYLWRCYILSMPRMTTFEGRMCSFICTTEHRATTTIPLYAEDLYICVHIIRRMLYLMLYICSLATFTSTTHRHIRYTIRFAVTYKRAKICTIADTPFLFFFFAVFRTLSRHFFN